ncbi:MAG: sigma-54 dependent transcriptional regulator [Bdellovibrionia bacterium]
MELLEKREPLTMYQPHLRVLLVDDDKNIRKTLQVSLSLFNCEVLIGGSFDEALRLVRTESLDLMLTDFRLSADLTGKSGLDLIKAAKISSPQLVTVMMTAYTSFENAVLATKEGAYDYLPKPFSRDQLEHLLKKVRTVVSLQKENYKLKKAGTQVDYFRGMTSPSNAQLEDFVSRVAPTEATVLLVGESGTGKSELAKLIHERSPRSTQPFVIVNCTSLAESLFESEIFGHVRGAFTGAFQDRAGKFELANKGTLFLDEIGDLSMAAQAKLLRFLQERVIERVGSNKLIQVDTRVVAATNKVLDDAVKTGRFREDLYYRLNVFECILTPLRHRMEDLRVLIRRFLQEFSVSGGMIQVPEVSDSLFEILETYSWPGNIRELRNVIQRLVFLAVAGQCRIEDLPATMKVPRHNLSIQIEPSSCLIYTLEEMEKAHVSKVLSLESNQEKAAEILGITTVTLWRKRKQYGLP